MKKLLKTLLCILLVLIVIVLIYAAYVFIAYHRIEDRQPLTVDGQGTKTLTVGENHRIVTWNIGFGAYEDDYSFFMDGGTQSWAWSKDRLTANLAGMAEDLAAQQADIWLIQELDWDATRTYYVDERPYFTSPERSSVYAVNFDSPFLMYPILQPHGFARSGLLTVSDYPISAAVRRSFPVDNGPMKIVDLDRCYTVNRIPTDDGKELVLYNMHMTAYASSGSIADDQVEMLLADMQAEFEAGNYVIAGGDMNKDLLGNSGEIFGVSGDDYSWAQPFKLESLVGRDIRLVAALNPEHPVASCRNADAPVNPGQFRLTADGYLVSANVAVNATEVIDLGFRRSDHQPVVMDFTLNPDK